jgi:hypothetical protein
MSGRTYQVVAAVIRPGSARQLPIFFLDSQVQGIISANHAAEIAQTILNPFEDPNTNVYATVRCVETGEYAETPETETVPGSWTNEQLWAHNNRDRVQS